MITMEIVLPNLGCRWLALMLTGTTPLLRASIALMNKSFSALAGLLAALAASSFVTALAQNAAPPIAPARQFSSPGRQNLVPGNVLNGSVTSTNSAAGGARLNRPVQVLNSVAAPLTASGAPATLFSAADQAAFSYTPPAQSFASSASSATSALSARASAVAPAQTSVPRANVQKNEADFDFAKALSFGASVVNQLKGPGITLSGRNDMNGQNLFKPAFISKFAVPLTAQELNILSQYDVVLVLDQSGSMDERDCPGGMSRWDWCRDQMMSLTAQVASVFKNGITVALYSSDYEIFRNVDLNYVTRIFAEHGPTGATFTGKTVQAVLDDYFARRASSGATRKLLVQVVTDGDPSDKGNLIAAIARATQQMRSPQEITINFIQIGNESAGANTLAKLDHDLAREGAQFDIVKVVPFASVAQTGLPRALVDATR
jgi:hypothetical protein